MQRNRHQNRGHRRNNRHNNRGRRRPNRRVNRRPLTFGQKFYRFVRKHPLISAVGSMLLSVILMRLSFSNTLLGGIGTEFRFWFFFFAFVLGLIGFFAIYVWFRNNVSNFNVKANLNWRNR